MNNRFRFWFTSEVNNFFLYRKTGLVPIICRNSVESCCVFRAFCFQERSEKSHKKGKKAKNEKWESEPDEAAESSEHSASKERIERSKEKAKKAKKEQRGSEPDEVAESSYASKVRSERSKKKGKKAKKEKKESEPVEKKERDEAVESSKEHEKSSKKKKEKERRRKERMAAKSKTRNLVKVLVSSGKYPESWFFQNKEMLHDMVLAIYWGPAWPNSLRELLREWFIQGGWPWKPSEKEPSDSTSTETGTPFIRSFDMRNFNERLLQDMDRYWPETMKRLWKHEWQTHGRHTGMSAEEYFSTILDIYHAIMAHGINLQCGVSMQAHQAIACIEQTLGRVKMSAFRLEDATEVNTELYIRELKIHINRKSYGIVSSSDEQRYLGQITKADNLVVLPMDPVRLCKLAEQ